MSKASRKYRYEISRVCHYKYSSKDYRAIRRILGRSKRELKKSEKDYKSQYNNYIKYRDMESVRKGLFWQLPIGYKEQI